MNIDEFIRRVAGEPETVVTQTVRIRPPGLLESMTKEGPMLLSEYLSQPGFRTEQPTRRYRHILGPAASNEMIDRWQREHPAHSLPDDLRQVVSRVNGIHLWADESGRAYEGLAPIEEWDAARIKMYGPDADPALLDEKYLALTYHQDHAAFAVLDIDSGGYFLMDTCGADASTPIATNAGELLDWLWQSRLPPT